jgi:RNA polymerase sigma-70 factor, ECF subfamily
MSALSTWSTWGGSRDRVDPWMQALADTRDEARDELALVTAARDGDQAAFGRLVRRHQERVFRLAGRFFRRREDVEDVAQETFLSAWEKLATYRAEAPFEHWLTRVCLNTCYGRLRRQKPEAGTASLDDETVHGPEPAAPAADATARLEVERLLARLAPADRMVLTLLDGEGWSTAEIAERLGWTRANVKVRAHRARKALRSWIEEGLDDAV